MSGNTIGENAFCVDADISAGNIIVEKIDGDDVYMRPDLRDTKGHWFYWHCRVRGALGRNLRFHMTSENTLTAAGPAVSLDGGNTWRWLGADSMDGWSFGYDVEADDIRLSMGMPYTRDHLDAFLAGYAGHSRLAVETLCTSLRGRPVPLLRVGGSASQSPHRLLVTARHHCCEMMASYALEGLLARALADDELGLWLAANVDILVVPLVDTDGVADGDQGKNRQPHDHNRDYAGESIYPETAAIRRLAGQGGEWCGIGGGVGCSGCSGIGGGGLTASIDLHCPWIRGEETNERIYLVGSRYERIWSAQCVFGELLEQVNAGPLPYRASDNLPFGQSWNVPANQADGKSCSGWMAEQDGIKLATSVELPYARARGSEVNAASARVFGGELAQALRLFLETSGHCA